MGRGVHARMQVDEIRVGRSRMGEMNDSDGESVVVFVCCVLGEKTEGEI